MDKKIEQKIGVIVQVRMGSTRLPGKVMKLLDNEDTVLDVLIRRLKLSKLVDEIVIATTPDKRNSVIVDLANSHLIPYFIGSEENVLERFYKAARKFKLDIIIRITSDCPFIDPKILDDMIDFYLHNNYDYIKNIHESSNFPRGFDVEIFSLDVLENIYSLAKNKPEKEHVTYYIYTHPKNFNIFYYNLDNLKKFDKLRLTIDEEQDLILCREIYKKLKENSKTIDFSLYDILEIIENNPELMNINKQIKQKKV